jgi:hypothetical protein
VAHLVIFQLDVAQQNQCLSDEEKKLRAFLKDRLLGFAAIDRYKWWHRTRMVWIKEGDAN